MYRNRSGLLKHALVLTLFALAACGGDKTKDDASSKSDKSEAMSPDQYRNRQQRFADSVLNTATPAAKVVEAKGKGYAIGPVALRDTIASLAGRTGCLKAGRTNDPYLAGTVSVFAHMSVIGVDLIRVQQEDTKWTSRAGDLVNACLDTEMKKWKLDTRFGPPAAYIVQVQFRSDPSMLPKAAAAAKAQAAEAAEAAAKKP